MLLRCYVLFTKGDRIGSPFLFLFSDQVTFQCDI